MRQTLDHFSHVSAKPRRPGRILSLSALGLFVMFAGITYGGANIAAFELLERWVRGQPGQPIENMLAAVSTWKNTNGVAARARNLALDIVLAENRSSAEAIENALDQAVEASPTSVAAWQARADYQRALGVPMERVLPGFRMSVLTGSHEGPFMARRVRFGLEYWTELPEQDRRTVIRDLVGSASEFGPDQYRNIVAAKSPSEREEIRSAVMATGRGSKALLQALGI